MEQAEAGSSSGSYDKSRVLDVRPLRCLVPWFPAPPLGYQTPPPFVYAPPFGPYPSGYSPFYPFFNPSEPQRPPSEQNYPQNPNGTSNQGGDFGYNHNNPPSPSFRTPPPQFGADNGDAGPSRKSFKAHESGNNKFDSVGRLESEDDVWSNNRKRTADYLSSMDLHSTDIVEITPTDGEKQKSSKSRKRVKPNPDIKFLVPADGDRESVGDLLLKFDALRRKLAQLEDTKEVTAGIKRADLKAGTLMFNYGLRTNTKKRIGIVPGVEIGDVFFFRIEMCLVGLHAPIMAGIDYMGLKFDQEEETVAVSIVSSGGYEDDAEYGDVLIYSGQGGAANKREGKEAADQKLERGNLALERSLRRGNEVRVIRGVKDVGNPSAKVYIYDGLYRIHESWMEKGKAGCSVFKYKLMRIPGQPEAFVVWKSIQLWKDNTVSRPGVILPDLTSGAEKLPVCLVNDVDDDKGPAHFTYFPSIKYSKPVHSMAPSIGCNCRSACVPGDPNCACVRKNKGDLPYISNGILVVRKPFIHECGPSCLCYPNCKNQVSQNGLRIRLEVFKTKDKGWGLRSWDPIRAGMFICEYAGQVVEKSKLEEDEDEEDEYIFNAARSYDKAFKWNYIPELLGEDSAGDPDEVPKTPLSLIISAKHYGNVARFMNHSCSPNLFWQPVLYEHSDESSPHIVFYAIKHIPPMTELTYDYGLGESSSGNARGRRKQCLCNSFKCRGYFG
ncbi:SET domain [Macleaya cordata]|uniref:SET domain n=1 Tax=Macleaya cordata TaxID=56857 RepID=A0A200QTL0_MACCD|nr:SET domain [Macleaya cordata]